MIESVPHQSYCDQRYNALFLDLLLFDCAGHLTYCDCRYSAGLSSRNSSTCAFAFLIAPSGGQFFGWLHFHNEQWPESIPGDNGTTA